MFFFFFSSRRRHTRLQGDWSSDVCSSDLRWVDFVPACDVELKRQAGEASKALGAEVVFEFINANDLQPRITASIQSGAGPDIIMMLHNWPHLYQNGLVDVTDLGEWQGKEQGCYYPQPPAAGKDGKPPPAPAPRMRGVQVPAPERR